MSEREIQELRDDIRRATMMARENRQDIAGLRTAIEQDIADLRASTAGRIKDLRTLIEDLK